MLYGVFTQIFFHTNLSIYFRFFPLLGTLTIAMWNFRNKSRKQTIGKKRAPLASDNH